MLNDTYVVIQGWMSSELKLKGNDLLIYALIYGFSQDNESVFRGSRSYIAEMFNITLPTVDKSINNLINQGLIEKITETVNNVSFNSYKILRGSKESLLPVKNLYTINNNINNSNLDDIQAKHIKNNNTEECDTSFQFGETETRKPKKPNLFDKCVEIIADWTNVLAIRELLIQYLRLCLEMQCIRGSNQWKGMLNTLERVQQQCNSHTYEEIIEQSITRGWKTFYPINDYSSKPKKVENFTAPKIDVNAPEHQKAVDENGKPLVF